MEWSGQQAAAIKAVAKWARSRGGKQIFRLFGYAGSGEGYFTSQTPDIMLTEIHRQAADNPIIRLSMDLTRALADVRRRNG